MKDPEYIYFGTVKDGQIKLPGKKMRRELANIDGPIQVVIKKKRKRRSLDQNNYYWGCLVPALKSAFSEWSPETGWTSEMVHEYLKNRFLPQVREWGETVTPDGEAIPEPATTKKLTTIEFSHYKELIQLWASTMDILIPDPGEQAEMFQNNTI